MAFDPFETPFGENDLSWDLEPDTNTSPIMTIPGDSENVQVMRVQLAPADGSGVETTKGKRSKGTGPGGDRITVWNRTSKRKVSGNAAPMEKNLQKYLSKHPDCELYNGQDKLLTSDEKLALIAEQNRIPIWNKLEQRKISGNAAPSEKNLADYLRNRPHCEVYTGQNQPPGTYVKPEPAVKPPQVSAGLNEMYMDEDMADLLNGAHGGINQHKMPEPIPKNTSLADMFHAEDAEMYSNYSNLGRDIPSSLKVDEGDVFSMSGLADSLNLDMGFLDMCGGSMPGGSSMLDGCSGAMGIQDKNADATSAQEGDMAMAFSPAQLILNDRAARAQEQAIDSVSGVKRERSTSSWAQPDGVGIDMGGDMGMSFSYRDLIGMSAGGVGSMPGGFSQPMNGMSIGNDL